MLDSRTQYSVIFAFGIVLGLISGTMGLKARSLVMLPNGLEIMYMYGVILCVFLISLASWGKCARYILYILSYFCLLIFVMTMVIIFVNGAHFGEMVTDISEERQQLYGRLTARSELCQTASIGFMAAALIPLWWARWRKPRERP